MTTLVQMIRITVFTATVFFSAVLAPVAAQPESGDSAALYAETFDAHWEALRDNYPYFKLYDVDWDAERSFHRPRALAAVNDSEFAWELARLISALPDPHVSFLPAIETMKGHWSVPKLKTHEIERRQHVVDWGEIVPADLPAAFAGDPHAYPEVIAIQGEPAQGAAEILAGGPMGTSVQLKLRWPDRSETVHLLQRPAEPIAPPTPKHFGERWLVTGRVGDIGYMRVQSFSPESCTLGADGKMTTMLRAGLKELAGTKALILDLQGNGGGLVAASDPFLGNIVTKRLRYEWGNTDGQTRVIRPRSPRYRGEIVALVDERSASGGEWAARILRDAGRATVVGGRTAGAEAAVHTSNGADGSVVKYSAWPMVEKGRPPFQELGIELDHSLPLTLQDVRSWGLEDALVRVRRARFAKALDVLGAPASDLDAFLALARQGDEAE